MKLPWWLLGIWAVFWAALWPVMASSLGVPGWAVAAAALLAVAAILGWLGIVAAVATGLPRGGLAGPSQACTEGRCGDCSGFLCNDRCHARAAQLGARDEYVIPKSTRNEWN